MSYYLRRGIKNSKLLKATLLKTWQMTCHHIYINASSSTAANVESMQYVVEQAKENLKVQMSECRYIQRVFKAVQRWKLTII